MKKTTVFLLCLFLSSLLLIAQETLQDPPQEPAEEAAQAGETAVEDEEPSEPPKPPVLNVGKVYFPRAFIHAGKDYAKGVYRLMLTVKDDQTYFKVFNRANEFLFDEMAIVKPYTGKSQRFKYRIKREMLRGYEYFRVVVTRPDSVSMAYFLLQQAKQAEPVPAETKEEPSETEGGEQI